MSDTKDAPGTAQATDNAYMEAIRGSLLPAATGSHVPAMLPPERRTGFLARWFGSAEDRRHDETTKAIRNVGTEAVLAESALSMVTSSGFAAGLEAEAEMEEAIRQHQNSALAMAAAPHYAQISRAGLSSGISAVVNAAVSHIVRKISDR